MKEVGGEQIVVRQPICVDRIAAALKVVHGDSTGEVGYKLQSHFFQDLR